MVSAESTQRNGVIVTTIMSIKKITNYFQITFLKARPIVKKSLYLLLLNRMRVHFAGPNSRGSYLLLDLH